MPAYDPQNIFAKILEGAIPSTKIFENDICLAIMDAFPQSPGHGLVLPKSPSRNLLDADPDNLSRLIPQVQKLAQATSKALNADGIRIAQFNEAPAGQTVFHLHFHVIPIYEGQEPGRHADKMADPEQLAELAARIAAEL
ncbi:MAG TPA: HIT family protein [Devosia sp.]|nr:HIT family protein [Devosia sp.]